MYCRELILWIPVYWNKIEALKFVVIIKVISYQKTFNMVLRSL